jgi:flagellar capping protein FliD
MAKLSGKAKASARKKSAQNIAKQQIAEKQKLIEQQYQESKELKTTLKKFSEATGAIVWGI